jgi:phage terminase Nu1 subunit (DNA packaging protein)
VQEEGAEQMASAKQCAVVKDGAVYVLAAGTKVYVKTADICAATGKSNQWIGQLTSQGILNKAATPHGSLYDAGESMSAYCRMLEDRTEGDLTDDDKKHERTTRVAEAMLKTSKATIARLEAQEMQGKMHRADDVAEFWDDMGYAIRAVMMALPGRVAVDVANATGADAALCAEIIKKECYKGLEELKRHRYDPVQYEEKVRGRMNWDILGTDADDDF